MGMEYQIVTTKNSVDVVAILEKGWTDAINQGTGDSPHIVEKLLRCTILHGYHEQGYDGFSFCDPMAPVGWHETLQVAPLWDSRGKPYIYVLSNLDSNTFHCFLTITKSILEMNGIQYEINEL